MNKKWIMANLLSKSSVKKAGERLQNYLITDLEYDSKEALQDDIDTLSTWRTLHEIPLKILRESLRSKLQRDGKYENSTLSRRLKRMSSIINKLVRFEGMSTARMQDIAGIRIIFSNINQVNSFRNDCSKSYSEENNLLFILIDEDDITTIG